MLHVDKIFFWWIKYFKKIIRLNRSQEPYNEKSFEKIKWLKSLQKAEVDLEPVQASTMELFCEYTYRLYIFVIWLHHRSSAGLYIGLWKYWNFQSEAKVEQIIMIVTTHSVSCFWVNLETAYIGQCTSVTDITHFDKLCLTIRVLLCILKGFLLSLGIFFLWASFKGML